MPQDQFGLPLTTASDDAAAAFDRAVSGFLGYQADAGRHLGAALAADPDFAMAHCLKGCLTMLGFHLGYLPAVREAEAAARRGGARATQREQQHIAALEYWADDDREAALRVWRDILAAHPRDLMALRLAYFVEFWLGRPDRMLALVDQVSPAWRAGDAGYAVVAGCRAFALEECGEYTQAEIAGHEALDHDAGDLWATHAVAHVLEMQGRTLEGIEWLGEREAAWQGGNNFVHHLWWHKGLFHYERGEFEAVLALYDANVRNLAAPLVVQFPDLYIDVQNAASMLFRLECRGFDVGRRWEEMADKGEARIGDCLSAFTLPHWMMALAAAGREDAAQRMVAAMRAYAQQPSANAAVVARYAVPVCEAVLAYYRREWRRAVELMRPAVGGMYRLGASHAQQDVLEQLFLNAALRAGLTDEIERILQRVAGRYPVPPQRRVGYADAARHVGFAA